MVYPKPWRDNSSYLTGQAESREGSLLGEISQFMILHYTSTSHHKHNPAQTTRPSQNMSPSYIRSILRHIEKDQNNKKQGEFKQ